uniref:Uncharacterized protein n=1 Tax=Oryzias latipes TaxID=8090 RepID=A0A3P9LYG5_ORYLA
MEFFFCKKLSNNKDLKHIPVILVRSFDGVEVPVDLAESEDDMKKMTVQEFKDKIQRLPGNPGTV